MDKMRGEGRTMEKTPGRFRHVVIKRPKQERDITSDVDVALDRLNRGITMPSVLKMLQEIEDMDEIVEDESPS
jgi:hypothetical protein